MHQFGWLWEKGGNFLNLLKKEGVTQKMGVPSEKEGGGGSNPGGNYGISLLCKTRDQSSLSWHVDKIDLPTILYGAGNL